MRSLLLNSNFEPLCFIDHVHAIRLVFRDKVDVVDHGSGPSLWDRSLRTQESAFTVPATLRLRKRVKVPSSTPRFHKRALFNRDDWTCQYCSRRLSKGSITVDHVVPRSKGGQTTWTNCVAACHDCNTRKRDMTPEKAGLRLRRQPVQPSRFNFMSLPSTVARHPDWYCFIKDI